MRYLFLPLLLVIGALCLALGPTSALMKSKPGTPGAQVFDPAAQTQGAVSITPFEINGGNQAAQVGDGEITLTPFAIKSTDRAHSAGQASDAPTATNDFRISQIYTHGGEPGATFQNNYVELFNAGSSNIDINGWSLAVITTGDPKIQGGTFNGSFIIGPGTHLLVRFNGNGTDGQPVPGQFPITTASLGANGQIEVVPPGVNIVAGCPPASGTVADFVAYGSSQCLAEGQAAPAPTLTKAAMRLNNGCTDTNNNAADFTLADPNPRQFSSPLTPCGGPQPTPNGSPTPVTSPTPIPGNLALRISQIYPHGGEPGATLQNDYVEIFNAGSSNIDINGWSLAVITFEGNTEVDQGGTFTSSFSVAPGTHLLVRFNGNGTNGQPVPGQLAINTISLGSTSGQIVLMPPGVTYTAGCPPATGTVADFVAYGSSQCLAEGPAAPTPTLTQAAMRLNNGCTDTNNNANDFVLANPNPRQFTSPLTPCGGSTQPTPTPTGTPTTGSQFNFSAAQYDVNESAGKVTIAITRTGDVSSSATIDGATSNGTAIAGRDYIGAAGTVTFAPGETSKSYDLKIIDDGTSEFDRTILLNLFHPTGNASLGATASSKIVIHEDLGPPPNPSPTATPPGQSLIIFQAPAADGFFARYDVNENAGKVTVTIVRAGDVNTAATVDIATSNRTAIAGSDYTTVAQTISFAPGQTQKTIDIPIIDDSIPEPDELFVVTLTNATGNAATGDPAAAEVFIHDNDGGPSPTPTPTPSPTPVPGGSALRISQIYTRGGESGATFQNDYVELFNAGSSNIDINGWTLVILSSEGSTELDQSATFNSSFTIAPGTHLLVRFNGNGTSGQPVPGQFSINTTSLGSTSGQIELLPPGLTFTPGCPPATGTVADFVAYGSSKCLAEGPAAPTPTLTKAAMRLSNGCTDTNNNANDFTLADPNPRQFTSPLTPCGGSKTVTSQINFSVAQFDSFSGGETATVTVNRSGDPSSAATVDYSTFDGTAAERIDYTTAIGTLRFAPGETSKTFNVLLSDNGGASSMKTVNLSLTNATGNNTGLGTLSAAQLLIRDSAPSLSNNVDNSRDFVGQTYHDFLNRAPDPAGVDFWVNNIDSCGSDANCRLVKRIDTSAAFFLSLEFQNTGFEVYRLYKASLPATSQRPRGFPRYREFVADSQDIGHGVIVNNPGYQQLLESNTVDFINRFVNRAEFLANFPATMTAAQYVDKLNSQVGNVLSSTDRNNFVNGLGNGQETRATVLRKIAENQTFTAAEFRQAFVLMQYYGYLRRNPDDLPDTDFSGFDFWLNKMNQFNGDYRSAEMVKAFITSSEYRNRFGP